MVILHRVLLACCGLLIFITVVAFIEICNKIATVICFLLYRLRSENYKKEGGPAQSSSVHCDGSHSGAVECMHCDSARLEVHPGVGLGSSGDLCPVGMWIRE